MKGRKEDKRITAKIELYNDVHLYIVTILGEEIKKAISGDIISLQAKLS